MSTIKLIWTCAKAVVWALIVLAFTPPILVCLLVLQAFKGRNRANELADKIGLIIKDLTRKVVG